MNYLKTILFFIILLSAMTVSAKDFEEGMLSAHAGISYGFDIEELGINAGASYFITEDMRVGGTFTYWLYGGSEESFGYEVSTNAFEINGHYHYIFYNESDFVIYGVGALGLHITSVSVDYPGGSESESDTEVALGLGAGFEYSIGNLSIFAEPKYFISGFDQLKLNAGVRFYL